VTDAHQIARLAAGVNRAARDAGVELTHEYATTVAANGTRWCDQLSVTRLGEGIVIHTAPEKSTELPIVLGYADHSGQWHFDGSRHVLQEADG
jgi:hypothetical protein